MSYSHADLTPFAEAEVLPPDAEEDNEVRGERLVQLFLDTDEVFRWYEEDEATEVTGETLHEALQEAESFWNGFQLVECQGEPVTPDTEINDIYAADALSDPDGDEDTDSDDSYDGDGDFNEDEDDDFDEDDDDYDSGEDLDDDR